jgi:hypothetical protein
LALKVFLSVAFYESAVRFIELRKKYWPGWEGETEVRAMMDGTCRD